MPEGPELHMAARFINDVAKYHKFGGSIIKSEVSLKNPDVEFEAKSYSIQAETRGKELKIFLADKANLKNKTHILFRFGMSGCFKFTTVEELPKHAHLRFFTTGDKKPCQVLSFVDYRRFGRWEIEGNWGKDRGPDPIMEYDSFRTNVLDNLSEAAFNKPICETLLNQKFFNGIGNYLRAEILYRAEIPPFTCARDTLQPLVSCDNSKSVKHPDILELCNIVPKEVLSLDKGKNYDPDSEGSEENFSSWLQCYYVDGMKNLKDGNGRTIWFSGDPGPMVPKNAKVVGRKGGTGSKVPKSGTSKSTSSEEKPIQNKNIKLEKCASKESQQNNMIKVEKQEDSKPEPRRSNRKTQKKESKNDASIPSKKQKKTKK